MLLFISGFNKLNETSFMPELPDIEVFSKNLHKRFRGKTAAKLIVVQSKKLEHTAAAFTKAIKGKKLVKVYRSGKEMHFLFEGDTVLAFHLMLTGDIFAIEKTGERKLTIVELWFTDGSGLALTDRMKNANVKLNPPQSEAIDALDPKLNMRMLKQLLQRNTSVKNVLLDQKKILGIGNGYSDEILWESGISPFSIAKAIPDEKVRELSRNIKSVLRKATAQINKQYPDLIHGEVRDFMKIHTKKATHSPTGAAIKQEKRGMLTTYYTAEQKLYK